MGAHEHRTIPLVVAGPVAPGDVPGLCEQAHGLLDGDDADLFVCLGGLVAADVVAIDLVARLQLAARRHGRRLVVCHASTALQELLAFLGLDDVVPACRGALRLQARG